MRIRVEGPLARVTEESKALHSENMRRQWREKKDKIDELKRNPCMDCGNTFPTCAMQFDHRPGEVKKFRLGQSSNRSWSTIEAEIAKCDLVCANCHAIRTYERAK